MNFQVLGVAYFKLLDLVNQVHHNIILCINQMTHMKWHALFGFLKTTTFVNAISQV